MINMLTRQSVSSCVKDRGPYLLFVDVRLVYRERHSRRFRIEIVVVSLESADVGENNIKGCVR